MISVIFNPSLSYPAGTDFFSPQTCYPEYTFNHLSSHPNRVYESIRQTFAQAKLDQDGYDTPKWNPLGKFIKPGSRVFVLCNFVYHCRPQENQKDFSGKCTHGSVLRAVVDYILLAVGPNGKIRFGNAPLQSCHWESVLRDTGADRVIQFYKKRGITIEACDLRSLVAERGMSGFVGHIERRDEQDCVAVDLEVDSLVSHIQGVNTRFRVADYDPRRTEACHQKGRHVYSINRHILESDIVFSIPKLKTHEKVGMTCAIKGCVGSVGHKDSLTHHRFGSPNQGGDEYPSDMLHIRSAMSHLHDAIQKLSLESKTGRWLRLFDRILRRAVRPLSLCSGGAWWGNDTCWRMAVDLARILAYADQNGKMQEIPVRPHLTLIDGIVGGEGQGPLTPSAVDSGVLIFGDNIASTDWTAAILMGYDTHALPIVREATRLKRYPLLTRPLSEESIINNGTQITFDKLKQNVKYHYRPPYGWKDRL